MNSVAWYNQSTQALPFTTIILLSLIWLIGKSVISFSYLVFQSCAQGGQHCIFVLNDSEIIIIRNMVTLA